MIGKEGEGGGEEEEEEDDDEEEEEEAEMKEEDGKDSWFDNKGREPGLSEEENGFMTEE